MSEEASLEPSAVTSGASAATAARAALAGPLRRARRLLPAAGALLAGAAYALACPPWEVAALAWIAPGLLLVAARRVRPRAAFGCGLLFALAMGMGVTGWAYATTRAYFGLGPIAAAAFVAVVWLAFGGVQYGLLAAAYSALAPRVPAALRPLVGAWLWVVAEMLRARLFTGMPWELLGHTQYARLALVQIADLGGVYAVSFVVALASAALAEAIAARERRPRALALRLGPAVALLLATVAYGERALAAQRAASSSAPAFRVAVVQANVPSRIGWQRIHVERALAQYAELSSDLGAVRPDLVVWPEYAAALYLDREPLARMRLARVAARASGGLLLGAPRLAAAGEARNSAVLLDGDGAIAGVYDKRRLVPLAEVDPFAHRRGDGPVFTAGEGPQLLSAAGARIGAVICYEALFPHLVRELVLAGADVLVNLTNESWLDAGDGAAPSQQFSMAIFRAIETRRSLARAASTGVSGFVSPAGDVLRVVPAGTAGVAVADLPIGRGLTPYVRWGETWVAAAGVLLAGAVAAGRRCSAR